jgi:hypothetical protein
MAGLNINLYGSTGAPPRVIMGMPGYSRLGRGLKGFSPQWGQNDDHTFNDVEQQRYRIVESWNSVYKKQLADSKLHRVITPFRAVTNSGDILSRKYYSCGGPCQTFQYRPNLHGLKTKFGRINSMCDNTKVPAAACNVKYVYDNSDYLTYLKQKAIVKNFNDIGYGGDDYHSTQVISKAIRRY